MATVLNDREVKLRNTVPRIITTSVTISSNNKALFNKVNITGDLVPSSMILSTTIINFDTPTYSWYYKNNDLRVWNNLVGNVDQVTITSTDFLTHVGNGNSVTYKVVCEENLKQTSYDEFIVTYYKFNYTVSNDIPFTKVSNSEDVLNSDTKALNFQDNKWMQFTLEGDVIFVPFLKKISRDGLFVAISNNVQYHDITGQITSARTKNVIAVSEDAVVWTYLIGLPTDVPYTGVFGNGKLVIITQTKKLYHTTDLINWTEETLPASYTSTKYSNYPSIRYINNTFIISIDYRDTKTLSGYIYSTNLIDWYTVNLDDINNNGEWFSYLEYYSGRWIIQSVTVEGNNQWAEHLHTAPNLQGPWIEVNTRSGLTPSSSFYRNYTTFKDKLIYRTYREVSHNVTEIKLGKFDNFKTLSDQSTKTYDYYIFSSVLGTFQGYQYVLHAIGTGGEITYIFGKRSSDGLTWSSESQGYYEPLTTYNYNNVLSSNTILLDGGFNSYKAFASNDDIAVMIPRHQSISNTAVFNSQENQAVYSYDGINWIGTLPSSKDSFQTIIYCKNKNFINEIKNHTRLVYKMKPELDVSGDYVVSNFGKGFFLYGTSVTDDGNTLVSYGNTTLDTNDYGTLFILSKNSAGVWFQKQKIMAEGSDANFSIIKGYDVEFGVDYWFLSSSSSVKITPDGNYIVAIEQYSIGCKRLVIYKKGLDGLYTLSQTFNVDGTEFYGIFLDSGTGISLNNDTMVAYATEGLYTLISMMILFEGNWVHQYQSNWDYAGNIEDNTNRLSYDGNIYVTSGYGFMPGGPGVNETQGFVLFFKRTINDTWELQQTLYNFNTPTSNGYFGTKVSLSSDGHTVVVLDNDLAKLYIYQIIPDTWTWQLESTLQLGPSVTNGEAPHNLENVNYQIHLTRDGNTLYVSCFGNTVYANVSKYVRDGTKWNIVENMAGCSATIAKNNLVAETFGALLLYAEGSGSLFIGEPGTAIDIQYNDNIGSIYEVTTSFGEKQHFYLDFNKYQLNSYIPTVIGYEDILHNLSPINKFNLLQLYLTNKPTEFIGGHKLVVTRLNGNTDTQGIETLGDYITYLSFSAYTIVGAGECSFSAYSIDGTLAYTQVYSNTGGVGTISATYLYSDKITLIKFNGAGGDYYLDNIQFIIEYAV